MQDTTDEPLSVRRIGGPDNGMPQKADMICTLSDEELWSGIDRNAPDIAEHIAQCASCRDRAAQFQNGISAVAASAVVTPAKPLPAKIGPYLIRRRLGEGGIAG